MGIGSIALGGDGRPRASVLFFKFSLSTIVTDANDLKLEKS